MSDNQSVQLLDFIWRQNEIEGAEACSSEGVNIKVAERYGSQTLKDGSIAIDAKLLKGIEYRRGIVLLLASSSAWYNSKAISQDMKSRTLLVVTLVADQVVMDNSFEMIDLVEMRIPDNFKGTYDRIIRDSNKFCRRYLSRMPKIQKVNIMERLIVERLNDKADYIMTHFNRLGCNWDDTFVFMLFDAISIGNKNRTIFNALADNIRYGHILKELHTIEQKEALVFGAAGLLEQVDHLDDYAVTLRTEFLRIRRYYKINMINASAWNFSSRNANNTVHTFCAYLVYILHYTHDLMGTILGHYDLNHLGLILEADTSPYWHTHKAVGSKPLERAISRKMARPKRDLMVLNYAIPMLFAYHREYTPDDGELTEKILDSYLPNIVPESNSIISSWICQEYAPLDSFDAQALLQVSKCYCKQNRCIECHIGKVLLRAAYRAKR